MKKISSPFGFRLRTVIVLSIVQLCCTVALVVWWGHLLVEQAEEISELKSSLNDLGHSFDLGRESSFKKMIIYESAWFIAVVVVASLFLVGLYFRDIRRSSSLRDFFASLTHELKTPLTSIRLQAETIEDYTSDDQSLQLLSRRLLEDTSRLENRVERTLELARVEGSGVLHLQDINLKQCIDQVVRTSITPSQRRIDITNDADDLIVRADSNALRIVVTNLIESSILHGGKEFLVIGFSATMKGDMVVLTYKDNGVGVSGDMKKLGELFYRGKSSQGAGIGLYLVSSLVRGMGGEVDIQTSSSGFTADISFLKGNEICG